MVRSEVAIQDDFGIGDRTVLRWVAACCREVVDPSGHPPGLCSARAPRPHLPL